MERSSRRVQWSLVLLCAVMSVVACRDQEEQTQADPVAEQPGAAKIAAASPAQVLFQSTGLNLEKGAPLVDVFLSRID